MRKDGWRSARMVLRVKGERTWPQIRAAVEALPRTWIVGEGENILRAECRSRVVQYIDDLRAELCGDELTLESEARSGLYDFGVNGRRLNTLQRALVSRGLVR